MLIIQGLFERGENWALTNYTLLCYTISTSEQVNERRKL